MYWLKQPIGWFVVAAAMSLMVGFFLGAQGFVLCAAIVAVIALGVIWPWLAIRAVRVTLRFDRHRTREGEPVTVELQVSNRLPWPVWGLAIEDGFLAAEQQVTSAIRWPWRWRGCPVGLSMSTAGSMYRSVEASIRPGRRR